MTSDRGEGTALAAVGAAQPLVSGLSRSAGCDSDTSSSGSSSGDEADAARGMDLLAAKNLLPRPQKTEEAAAPDSDNQNFGAPKHRRRQPLPGACEAHTDLAGSARIADIRVCDALPATLVRPMPPAVRERVVRAIRVLVPPPSLQSVLNDETGSLAAANALTSLAVLCTHAARPFCDTDGRTLPAMASNSSSNSSNGSATPRFPFLVSDVALAGGITLAALLDKLCFITEAKERIGERGLTRPLLALTDE